MEKNGSRIFRGEDGIEYKFNHEKFREKYNMLQSSRGNKKNMLELLSKRTNRSEEAVKNWIKKTNGPSDLETVYIIEDAFNVERGTFLTPLYSDTNPVKENKMLEIPTYERDIARNIYMEMCDMIHSAEYMDDELSALLCGRNVDFGTAKEMRTDNEYKREQWILKVRKAGFDIPTDLRDKLLNLVNKTFGPWDVEEGNMYFGDEEYRKYLQKNSLTDTTEARYLYSDLFIAGLYQELDDIFKEYKRR